MWLTSRRIVLAGVVAVVAFIAIRGVDLGYDRLREKLEEGDRRERVFDEARWRQALNQYSEAIAGKLNDEGITDIPLYVFGAEPCGGVADQDLADDCVDALESPPPATDNAPLLGD